MQSGLVSALRLSSFLLFAGLLAGCADVTGSGTMAEETRATGSFTRVSTHSGIELALTIGPATSVKLSGDDNLLPLVLTEVSGGELSIEFDDMQGFSSEIGLRAEVSAPEIVGVGASGGSTLRADGIDADAFSVEVSGGSPVSLHGSCGALDLSASGGSTIDGFGLACKKAALDLSGGSKAELSVSDEVSADLSGGSEVTIAGSPKITHQELSGGSTLKTQ